MLDSLRLDMDRQDLSNKLSFCLDSHIRYLENFPEEESTHLRMSFPLPGFPALSSESVHEETTFDREEDVMYVRIEDPSYASVCHVAPYQTLEAHSK